MKPATRSTESLEITAEYIRDVAVFCLTHGAHLYRDWHPTKLFKYLSFHFMCGTLGVMFDGEQIAGVSIVWTDSAQAIADREARGEYHFNWQMPCDRGDAYMIADVIVRKDEQGLTRLLQLASAMWPDWKMRRLFTHRHGRLVELSHAALSRFFHEQPQHT